MAGHRIYGMRFGDLYPLYVAKAGRKGRTKAEVDAVFCWLTGYGPDVLEQLVAGDADVARIVAEAPAMNPQRKQITGRICGVRIEEIDEPLMQDIRRLDKLVDELAKGRPVAKILDR